MRLFGSDLELNTLRAQYAIKQNPIPDAAQRQAMTAFFFWTSWSTVDEPAGRHDHLHQQLAVRAAGRQRADGADVPVDVHQHPRDARRHRRAGLVLRRDATARKPPPVVPDSDPLSALKPTPSMKATAKYFWVVTALIVVQVMLGGITAHYAVEGQALLRHPARRVPALRRHAQLAPAARRALDRHRVARHGPLHRTGDLGARTEVPAVRRELPVHLPAGDRGRRARRPVVRRDAEDGPRRRTSGSATRATNTPTSAASGRSSCSSA